MQKTFKLLIVDDDKISLALMREILVKADPRYEILTCCDSAEALRRCTDGPVFDLVLLDVMMPVMDGYALCARLKDLPAYLDVPVIFITGLSKINEKLEAFKAGAVDYLVKPVETEEMKIRVKTHLRIKEYQDQLKEAKDIILRAQSTLVENAKMSAIGTLATGIAHEFNNILFMMKGYAEIADWHQEKDDLHKSLKVIEGLIDRGTKIVRKLNDFSRKDDQEVMDDVDMRLILAEDLDLLRKRFEATSVQYELHGEAIPLFKGYPTQLSQLFVNLVRNALDAMKGSPVKKIVITTKLCVASEKICLFDPACECPPNKRCAVVSVRDSGCGVAPEVRSRLFEPFVTTKGVIGGGDSSVPGMGLGLSICYGIIKRHNGRILCHSYPGGGTEFVVIIPMES